MKASLRTVDDHGVKYEALLFICPGCANGNGSGYHMLPVNSTTKSPSWNWDGNIEAPTLSPSILTHGIFTDGGYDPKGICHSFLRNGVFEFLSDCTHQYAGQSVPMPDMPDHWATEEDE